MSKESYRTMLTGGHPNSLGRTIEVFEDVISELNALAQQQSTANAPSKNSPKLDEIYHCYFSEDEIVRLRTSSVMKRIVLEDPTHLIPYMDDLLQHIACIPQASTQWTLAILFAHLRPHMSNTRQHQAEEILKANLSNSPDWIVLNTTMQTLANWAKEDTALHNWLQPQLQRLSHDTRKSVATRAKRFMTPLKLKLT